ncbi:MAG: ScyD/ScyE family protein [Salinibacter sp.]
MTRFLSIILLACLSLVLLGCEDGAVAPHSEAPSASSEVQDRTDSMPSDPASVLSGRPDAAGLMGLKSAHGPSSGFATPLFGLDTAPNGDVLVADAGAGIATRSGATDIPFPGVTDMSPLGRRSMWALKGLTGDPGDSTGQGLYRATNGKTRLVADLYAFEKENNPDGAPLIDSNPYDVQSLGGRAALVADAGGNDLLRVDNQGNVEVLAVLPTEPVPTANIKGLVGCPNGPPGICGLPPMIPAQAVPTSVAIGPDGSYYVGELKGFPAPTGESNVWKIAPDASGARCPSPHCRKVFDGGFTSIIDLRFDDSGTLHVVELEEKSWFAVEALGPGARSGGTVNACNLSTTSCTERASGLPIPTAITFGKDGTLWATKNALVPGSATVVKIP